MVTAENGNSPHSLIRKFMVTEVPRIEKGATLKDLFSMLKKQQKEFKIIDEVYILDENQKLAGVLPIKDIFSYSEDTLIEKIMHTKFHFASPKTNIEKIAHLALKHSINTIPIVESGRLLGVIPPKSIAAILNTALRKDLFHFAGIHKSHLEYENSLTVPLSKSILHRVPWLIVGLIGALFVAAFIGIFEQTLEKYLILVFFMPAIVYLSDALGTQLQTLFIRDMAIVGEELKLKPYVLKQMAIALLISFIISILMFAVVSAVWNQPAIAFVISLAAFVSLNITSFTALLITILIQKAGFDPAMGGGPFATIISDAISIIVYFIVVTILL